jgi:aspartyl-tRNA(Asn)/glutamyl-tRNA(Gln) amidotransferase subunit C
VKNLVTKEEIIDVAKLMKIELEDHSQHMKRVQKMLEYFDILDKANIESDEILRDDKYIPYDQNLLKFMKTYKENYIKSPKLS